MYPLSNKNYIRNLIGGNQMKQFFFLVMIVTTTPLFSTEGVYEFTHFGRSSEITFLGEPAKNMYKILLQRGFKPHKCGSNVAIQSPSVICIQSPHNFSCHSILNANGVIQYNDNKCPNPSVIGVGNVD